MPPESIMRYFNCNHLPEPLYSVSQKFYAMAHSMNNELPDGTEKSVALRKLLESKDAAVRAALDME